MEKHCIIFLLAVIIVSTKNINATKWNSINNAIRKEKQYLLQNKTGCRNSLKKNPDSTFIRYFKNNDSISDNKYLQIIITALRKRGCCKSKYCNTILEESEIKLLFEIYSYMDHNTISSRLLNFLYERRNYELYKKNTLFIKKSIMDGIDLSQTKMLIYILCDLDKQEKEEIRKKLGVFFNDGFPLYIRIRLGEKEAQDTLLQMYEKETDFEKLKKLIEQLELAGTKRCEMALVNSLGTKDQEQHSKPGYSYSIKFFIIKALGKLNPNVSLLNDNFKDYQLEMEQYTTRYEINKQLTKDFYQKVYEWVKNKYGKEIKELKETEFLYSYWLFRTK